MTEDKVAVLLARIDERQQQLAKELATTKADVEEIKAQAQRWKGAFIVVLAVGGFVGWVLSQTKTIKDLLG